MSEALIVGGFVVVWVGSGYWSVIQQHRADFWKYPTIWEGPGAGIPAFLLLVCGPVGLLATLGVYGLAWPRIPPEAADLLGRKRDRKQEAIAETKALLAAKARKTVAKAE